MPGPKGTMLIVEDEALTAMHLRQELEQLGYEVAACVTSGEDALHRLTATLVDVVLMDIRLQGALDGIDTAARIRQAFDIPVVYLTAHSDAETLQRATRTGPYGYLRHPLYLGTLLIATGFAIMTWNGIALGLFGVFLLVYFSYYMPYKDRIESARLEAHFGDAFRRYAVAVPALVPRAYAYTPLAADQSGSPLWQARRFSENHELGTAFVVFLLVLAMVGRWASS